MKNKLLLSFIWLLFVLPSCGLDSKLKDKTVKTFVITSSAGENGSIVPNGEVKIQEGERPSYDIKPNEGFKIKEISIDGIVTPSAYRYIFGPIDKAHTIHVTFEPDVEIPDDPDFGYTWIIYSTSGEHGSIYPEGGVPVSGGESFSFQIIPEKGYVVDQLIVDDVKTSIVEIYEFKNVNAHHSISVTFKLANVMVSNYSGNVMSIGENELPIAGLEDVKMVAVNSIGKLALTNNGNLIQWPSDHPYDVYLPEGLADVKLISANYWKFLALQGDGALIEWGMYFGPYSSEPYSQTVFEPGKYKVKSIAVGGTHSLALLEDGTVVQWENDKYNIEIVKVAGLSSIIKIAAGYKHFVALKSDGTVVEWGDKSDPSSYFDGASSDYGEETLMPVGLSGVVAIAAGMAHTVAVKNDGTVVGWGYNFADQITISNDLVGVTDIVSSEYSSIAIKKDGTLFSLNGKSVSDLKGTLGLAANDGTLLAIKSDKSVVWWGDDISGEQFVPDIVSVDTDSERSIGIKSEGTIVAWGDNYNNKSIPPLELNNVICAIATRVQSIALKQDGTIVEWGGFSWDLPLFPKGLTGIRRIAATYDVGVAIKSDGTVGAWGDNYYGQLNVPDDLENVIDVSVGQLHVIALKGDGTVVAWGNNEYGQIDVPNNLKEVISISAGWYHNLALKKDGTVVGWGYNDDGETTIPSNLSDVVSISAGAFHSVALKRNGKVFAWGDNENGQIDIPSNLPPVASIDAGGDTTTFIFRQDRSEFSAIETHLISTATDANGSITASTVVEHGSKLTVFLTPKASYDVDVLKIDGIVVEPTLSYTFINVVKSHSVEVTYKYIYSIITKSGENGQISESILLDPNSNATITMTPDIGYEIDSLMVDGELVPPTLNYTFTNISANHTVEVRYKIIKYTISTTTGVNGIITPDFIVSHNETASVFITPEVGFGVSELVVDGVKVDPALYFTFTKVTANHTVDVKFKIAKTTVASAGSNGSISPSGNVNVAIGGNQTFTILPQVGYMIDKLIIDGKSIEPVFQYTFTSVASQHTIEVTFKASNLLSLGYSNGSVEGLVAIASSDSCTLALKYDGTVYVWNGHTISWSYENDILESIPEGLSNVVGIGAGHYHMLAIKKDRTVVAWGENRSGQTNVPLNLTGVIAVAGGGYHSVALKGDGTVIAWGDNTFGQTEIPSGLTGVKAIACGYNHTVALKNDGTVVAWGDNTFHQIDIPVDLNSVIDIAANNNITAFVKSDGKVIVIGMNGQGQSIVPADLKDVKSVKANYANIIVLKKDGSVVWLGQSNYDGSVMFPQLILSEVKAISAGNDKVCAIKTDGSVVEMTSDNYVMMKTMPPNLKDLVQISCGQDYPGLGGHSGHVLGLKKDGTVIGWGRNSSGQLDVPPDLSDVVYIATEENTSVAIKNDGTLVAWGRYNNIPANLRSVIKVLPRHYFVVALKTDGTVVTWGDNHQGERNVPVGLSDVVDIAASDFNVIALKRDGTLVAWGSNNYGESTIPEGLTDVKGVYGNGQALALKNNGTVIGWPSSYYSDVLKVPTGLKNIISLAGSSGHSVALKSDGSVAVWGKNDYGQLNIPVGLPPIIGIEASFKNTLLLFKQ